MSSVYRWRSLDGLSLEVLRLSRAPNGLAIGSTVVSAGKDAFSVDYEWDLDAGWRTRALSLRLTGRYEKTMRIERTGDAQ